MDTLTNDTIKNIVSDLSEAIAEQVMKNISTAIQSRVDTMIDNYVNSKDFTYTLEDIIKEQMESHVEDYVSGVSLSVRID